MIVSGGANIYPAEVEAALDQHPDVGSSIVIGLPDADLGHRTQAIVQVAEDARSRTDAAPVRNVQLLRSTLYRLAYAARTSGVSISGSVVTVTKCVDLFSSPVMPSCARRIVAVISGQTSGQVV
jgi:acyl-CoA synthetase (AMP-forming)/AMP-acid ligase II